MHFYSTLAFAAHRHSSYTLEDVLKQADGGAVKDCYLFVNCLLYSAVRKQIVRKNVYFCSL